jgi:hypothetical protein
MVRKYIPLGNGGGMHIARMEDPVAGYMLYLRHPGIEGTGRGEENGKVVRLLEKKYLLVMPKECI